MRYTQLSGHVSCDNLTIAWNWKIQLSHTVSSDCFVQSDFPKIDQFVEFDTSNCFAMLNNTIENNLDSQFQSIHQILSKTLKNSSNLWFSQIP